MIVMTERHVQAIWYDSEIRPLELYTRRGVAVRVITPGEWNLSAGPDFRHAVLELGRERRRLAGDVEVHLSPGDWNLHHHGEDPRYRKVIAHVTWGCGPVPDSLPSGAVSIWLGRYFSGKASFSTDSIDLLAYPYARLPEGERPCERAIAHNPELAVRLLAVAGRNRLLMKARRLFRRMECPKSSESQVFYEEVMSALGYSRNVKPFRNVAERIPIAELPTDPEVAKAALLAAGSFEEWDRVSVRPGNGPEHRLRLAAEVFTRTSIMELSKAEDFSPDACRSMITLMCGSHYMGRGRAGAVLANVIVPWAIAAGRLQTVPEWLPPEDISDPVRLTAFRLFGRDHNPARFYSTNGLLIQGLLQVHRDYCLQVHPDCDECLLGKDTGEIG